MLAGTSAPNSSRISVGGKSLLTGGIKEANSGGTAGDIMGRQIVHEIHRSVWLLLTVLACVGLLL